MTIYKKYEITGFEHIHRHTHHSLLDGFAFCDEYGALSKEVNQKYLCVTDHGSMSAIPEQIRACDKYGLKPIYGCELYVNPHQPSDDQKLQDLIKDWSDDKKKEARKSYHLLAIAQNNVGYKNLVKLSSWAWLNGFYRHPRVNHELLMQHKEGIIFTSCCYIGEIGQAFDKGGYEAGEEMLKKYITMFGSNFYLEIMLLDFNKQKPYNAFIVKMKEKYGIPIILTQDCHYARKEDSIMQTKMLMVRTGKTVQDIDLAIKNNETEDLFELQDQNLWMKSEDELNEKWESDYKDIIDYDLFMEAKANTVELCKKAEGVELDRSIKLPTYDEQDLDLWKLIEEGMKERKIPLDDKKYMSRIEEEYNLFCEKEICNYFIIQQKMIKEAKRWYMEVFGGTGSEAVGPGRGSGVGSLVCYVLGIVDVDPLKHDLLFSRFLSPARGGKQMQLEFSNKFEDVVCESPEYD